MPGRDTGFRLTFDGGRSCRNRCRSLARSRNPSRPRTWLSRLHSGSGGFNDVVNTRSFSRLHFNFAVGTGADSAVQEALASSILPRRWGADSRSGALFVSLGVRGESLSMVNCIIVFVIIYNYYNLNLCISLSMRCLNRGVVALQFLHQRRILFTMFPQLFVKPSTC